MIEVCIKLFTMKAMRLFCSLALLATFTSGVEIQCDFRIDNWENIGTLYTCRATVINMADPAAVTKISGIHLSDIGNADEKAFWILENKILSIVPNGIEKFFANLEALQWSSGNISSVDSSTFQPFPHLLHIDLGDNKLETLDGNLFQHTRKLRTIYLDTNSLRHIGHDLLADLTDLTYAYFQGNPCIDAAANTPQEIQDLNLQLPIQCPPSNITPDPPTTTYPPTTTSSQATTSPTTSKPNECITRCTSNEEADEMKNRIEILELTITAMESNSRSCNPH